MKPLSFTMSLFTIIALLTNVAHAQLSSQNSVSFIPGQSKNNPTMLWQIRTIQKGATPDQDLLRLHIINKSGKQWEAVYPSMTRQAFNDCIKNQRHHAACNLAASPIITPIQLITVPTTVVATVLGMGGVPGANAVVGVTSSVPEGLFAAPNFFAANNILRKVNNPPLKPVAVSNTALTLITQPFQRLGQPQYTYNN